MRAVTSKFVGSSLVEMAILKIHGLNMCTFDRCSSDYWLRIQQMNLPPNDLDLSRLDLDK